MAMYLCNVFSFLVKTYLTIIFLLLIQVFVDSEMLNELGYNKVD